MEGESIATQSLRPSVHAPDSKRGRALKRYARAKLDIRKLLKLRLQGLSQVQIARMAGVTESAVGQALKMFRPLIKAQLAGAQLIVMDGREDSLLDSCRGMILQKMTEPSVLETADLRDLAMAYDKLHLATRLRMGESTANVALRHVVSNSLSRARERGNPAESLVVLPALDVPLRSERDIEATTGELVASVPVETPPPGSHRKRGRPRGNASALGASGPSRSESLAGEGPPIPVPTEPQEP